MRPPRKILKRESSNGAVQELTKWEIFKMYAIEPLKLLRLLQYPPVILSIAYASVAFGALYIMNISVTYTFSIAPYNYNSTIVGLLYLGNSVGYLFGSVLGGRWSDYVFVRAAAKHGGVLEAEDRFGINAWVGVVMYPLGQLMYGWTVEKGLFVAIPEVGTFFMGFGMMIVFGTVTTYLIDAVPGRSSSAVAMNNLFRNILGCIGAVIGEPLIAAVGNGVLFSIVCGVALASSACIWAITRVCSISNYANEVGKQVATFS
jgi:MFS family permease